MGKWIVIGILVALLYLFCLGFKWIAVQAIEGFYEKEEDEGNEL